MIATLPDTDHMTSRADQRTGPLARLALAALRIWLLAPLAVLGHLLYGLLAPGAAVPALHALATAAVFGVPLWLVIAGILTLLLGMARRRGL